MFQLAFIFFLLAPNCKEAYLDKVLNSKGSDGYFVIFKCNVEGKENEIIASSYRLYQGLLSTNRVSDLASYVRFMKGKLTRNEPISFSVKELDKMDAGSIEDDSEVVALSVKSVDTVLNRYFYVSKRLNYARLNDSVPDEKIGSILKVLFQNNYLLRRVEGAYSVEELNFCSLVSK